MGPYDCKTALSVKRINMVQNLIKNKHYRGVLTDRATGTGTKWKVDNEKEV